MTIDTSQMCFVFGSNTGGIHGAGAAKAAVIGHGAKHGVGWGPTGTAYAIPTKGVIRNRRVGTIVGATLPLGSIKRYVDDFLKYAREHPDTKFQVTCIGCGLAGLDHEDIAPMFVEAPLNCYFDTLWVNILGIKYNYWGTHP